MNFRGGGIREERGDEQERWKEWESERSVSVVREPEERNKEALEKGVRRALWLPGALGREVIGGLRS